MFRISSEFPFEDGKLITVIGSSNTDFTIKAERIPVKGETILGNDFLVSCGGKGANQAQAIARLGAEVTFIGKIGADSFGEKAIEELKKAGVNTEYILRDELHHSGTALILVDEKGDNIISVFPGSNEFLKEGDILAIGEIIAKSKALVLQLEIPLRAVARAINLAYEKGVKVILNPAPAGEFPDQLLSKVDILVLNEREIELLTGMEIGDSGAVYEAAGRLLGKGVGAVVVTLGDNGAALIAERQSELIPAIKVESVDTTAAGDAFTAALTVAVVEGRDLRQSVFFANRVAALTTTKMGAIDSLPMREEVEKFIVKKMIKKY